MIPIHIPDSHRALLDGNGNIALATVMPSGQPQTTPVWSNVEGDYVLINTMRGFQKEKNMRGNPKVTLLAYHPSNPLHNIEIRGVVVEMTEVGALAHLDYLTCLYLHKPDAKFFGDSVPAEMSTTFVPVKIKIAPIRLRTEG